MPLSRRFIVTSAIGLAVLAVVAVGEVGARAAIDSRLDDTTDDGPTLTFAGRSALLAVATRHVPVTATFGKDDLTARLGEALDGRIDSVTLSDGVLGVESNDGIGQLRRPVTAWLTLAPGNGGVVATVISVEVAGLQLRPSSLLGHDLTFDLPDPITERCGDATHIDTASISRAGLELGFTLTPDADACLTPQENS